MTFAETYRDERLVHRRSRARKARIMGRVIGFCLTALFLVALRADPQLRAAVEQVALSVIGGVRDEQAPGAAQADPIDTSGYAPGSEEALALQQLGITGTTEISGATASTAPETSLLPESRIKINRGGSD
jgi:hypothetical protein